MPYKTWQVLKGTPQLQDPRGIGPAVQGAYGELKDDQLSRQKEAGLCAHPGLAPVDALPDIGRDSMLPQIAGETAVAYAERCRTRWDTWAQAGSVAGMLLALQRAGFPATGTLYVIEEVGYLSHLVSGNVVTTDLMVQESTGRPGWDFDSRVLNTRWALWFDTDHAGLDPSTPAGAASIAGLLQVVAPWKSASSTFWGIYVVLAGKAFGWPVATTWGQASLNWGADSIRQIRPDGSFIVDGP